MLILELPDSEISIKSPMMISKNGNHSILIYSTYLKPSDTYHNKIFWSPRFYQASYLSPEFLQEVRKFRNLKLWRNEHVLALTQLILIEAIRDTTFDYSFYYKAVPSSITELHGRIDCLLYQKYDDSPEN
jgi:hypothetical protein